MPQSPESRRNVQSQGSHSDVAHKKSSGHDNRDAAQKWKQGSESNDHEDEKLVEEYNKNKGRVYEKKWSWEKEKGSGHGWENQGHSNRDHLKGSNNREYESGSKGNQGKENWSQEKKKSHKLEDNYGKKFDSKGSKEEAKDSHDHHDSGINQFDDSHYRKQFSYL
ncbi:uncharacterized protein LOC128387296 [Panonychus citri]|uniref:uncharacterized protein LOC128386692 n=1 Tax=Panonychus citri TaxID=50023 RepID=UPI002308062C|nr:uncharacterized protein LOC128386692 [Panonychus citri]XP_053202444.1 uncharacterized protein LOC128387296 [Panonychus citri]